MSDILQRVYPNSENVADLFFKHIEVDGSETVLDLSGVTRAIVTLVGASSGADFVLDSSSGDNIYWDSAGRLEIGFFNKTIDDGEFDTIITLYDIQHTNGQIVVHPQSESRVTCRVINVT